MRRQQVIESLNSLPEEFDLDDLLEKLILIEKVEQARQEIRDGKTYTQQQVEEEMQKWRK